MKASYYREYPDGTDSIPRQGVPAALRAKFDAFMKSPKFMAAVRKNLHTHGSASEGSVSHYVKCADVKPASSGFKITFVRETKPKDRTTVRVPDVSLDDVVTYEELSDHIASDLATWGNAGDPYYQLKGSDKATYFFVFEKADTVVTFGPSARR